MVVDDEDANHRRVADADGGNQAATRVPPSWRGTTSRTPPSAAARSRIPRIPSEPGPTVPASVIPVPSSLISSVTHPLFMPSAMSTRVAQDIGEGFLNDSEQRGPELTIDRVIRRTNCCLATDAGPPREILRQPLEGG